MEEFKVNISSVSDREKLVAEIWYNEILVAEINHENNNLEIEFYLKENFKFDLFEFLNVINKAIIELN